MLFADYIVGKLTVGEGVGAICVVDDHTCGVGTVADTHSRHADALTQIEVQAYHELTDCVVSKVLAGAVAQSGTACKRYVLEDYVLHIDEGQSSLNAGD